MDKPFIQLVFLLPEQADDDLEDLLARHAGDIAAAVVAMTSDETFIQRVTQVCAYHTGTTVGPDLVCPMCLLDQLQALEYRAEEQEREGGMSVATEEAIWDIEGQIDAVRAREQERETRAHWAAEKTPLWVQRIREGKGVGKALS